MQEFGTRANIIRLRCAMAFERRPCRCCSYRSMFARRILRFLAISMRYSPRSMFDRLALHNLRDKRTFLYSEKAKMTLAINGCLASSCKSVLSSCILIHLLTLKDGGVEKAGLENNQRELYNFSIELKFLAYLMKFANNINTLLFAYITSP